MEHSHPPQATCSTLKNLFLMSNLNILSLCLYPLLLVLSLQFLVKSLSPASLSAPSDTARLPWGLQTTFSSPGWTIPAFSACLCRERTPVLLAILWPPLDLLQLFHVFLILRTPERYAEFQVGSHECRVKGENHLLHAAACFFECNPGFSWLSGLQAYDAGLCQGVFLKIPVKF